MPRPTIYYVVEPAEALPIWFSRVIDGMRKTCMKNRYLLQELDDVSVLDTLDSLPHALMVICSQNNWTQHIVSELRARHVMPLLLGVIPTDFGHDVSGIMRAQRNFVEKMMDYFSGCGRRHMALVGVNHNASNDNVKAEAFLTNARSMGLPTSAKDVYWIDEDITNCVIQCLENSSCYDSVICSNDYVAAILLAEARTRGVRIQEDLYVAGLGDTLIGRYTQPTLTTTSNDEFYDMGCQAVNMWKLLMDNPNLSNMTITVSTEITPRGSTAFAEPGKYDRAAPTQDSPSITIGAGSQAIRNLENCLRACDALDTQILHMVLQGQSNEQIENGLFLAHSSLHYRLRKLYQLANVSSRTELETLFKYYLPNF